MKICRVCLGHAIGDCTCESNKLYTFVIDIKLWRDEILAD